MKKKKKERITQIQTILPHKSSISLACYRPKVQVMYVEVEGGEEGKRGVGLFSDERDQKDLTKKYV